MKKRRNAIYLIVAAVMLAGFAFALFVYGSFGVENIDSISLFNIGYDVIAMVLSIILFLCCILDGLQNDSDRRTFMMLLFFDFFAMALDSSSYFLEGKAEFRWYHITDMTIVYILDYVIYYLLLVYLVTALDLRKEKPARILLWISGILSAGFAVSTLFNIKYPLYFQVNEAGEYSRGSLYFMNTLVKVVITIVILLLIITYRKKIKPYQFKAVLGYCIALDILLFVDHFAEFYIEYGAILLLLLIIYIILNVEKGNKGAVMEKEFATAKNIQASLLPNLFPDYVDVPEFEIYALMDPAREVGGDFYDFFMLDDMHFAFLLGDVSNHDVGGALFMAVSKSMLNMGAKLSDSPAEVLNGVNKRIVNGDFNNMHARVWLAFLDISTGHLTYSGACYPHLAVQDQETGGTFRYEEFPETPSMGEAKDPCYRNAEVNLVPGDRIFLYTAGVTDSRNKDREAFGQKRLLDTLNDNISLNNEELCHTLKDRIEEFCGEEQRNLDITMLCFTFKKPKEKEDPS